MFILLGAVGMVLLIVCANIAGLMLVRASVNARDFAVRTALGAGRWDLVRVCLAESVVLITSGVLLGLIVAYAGIRALILLAPERLAQSLTVRIDTNVLMFTLLAGIAALILFSVAPVWQIWRLGKPESLKERGRGGTDSATRQRLRMALVVGQVATALMLLVGAGVFLRTLAKLQQVNAGFRPEGVMTGMLALPPSRYPEAASRVAFMRALSDRLAAIPGVTSAGIGVPNPFSGGNASASFNIEGRPSGPGDPGPHGNVRYVSPGYFATLKIPLLAGRYFTDHDRQDSNPAIIIDETLAKQYWPNQDPIGKHMRRGNRAPWSTIIGVVGHVEHSDLAGDAAKGTYYYSMYQQPVPFAGVLVRTTGDPARLATPIRDAVRAVDPSQPIDRLKTMSDLVSASLAPRRFAVTLLAFFATSALFMAALGLYGVTSYSVAQRTKEIGIRIALGAETGSVIRLIVAQGLRLTCVGVLIGLIGSFLGVRLLQTQLAGVGAFDPITFGVMVLVLGAAGFIASYLPARRASSVDPTVALRHA
jgi:putative ABC transport system permease protein